MSQTEQDEQDHTSGEIFAGRTHAKILAGPVAVQLLMLGLHIATHIYLPQFFDWVNQSQDMFTVAEGIERWTPVVLHSTYALIAFIYVIIPILRWWNTRFILTEDYVQQRWGMIRRRSVEIQVARITQLEMERGLIDYLFGSGTLHLSSPGIGGESGQGHVTMTDVPKVKAVHQALNKMIRG